MTEKSFNWYTRYQKVMLKLLGFELVSISRRPSIQIQSRGPIQPIIGLNSRKRAMRDALHSLRKMTGVDFGYNPPAWRDYLMSLDCESGYTDAHEFERVDKSVQKAMKDKEIIETLKELEELGFPNIK